MNAPIIEKYNQLIDLITNNKHEEAYNFYFENNLKIISHSSGLSHTLLKKCCEYSSDDLAKELIKSGANVNYLDFENYTVQRPYLHTQIKKKSIEMVKFLLSYGADPYLTDLTSFQLTAIHHCFVTNNCEIACALIETSKNEQQLNKFIHQIEKTINNDNCDLIDKISIEMFQKPILSTLYPFIEKQKLKIKLESQIPLHEINLIKNKI